MKYNPFHPNNIISPGIFHGRLVELQGIEHGLFQAKHGNPVHFLIQGERGIGKPSLFHVVRLMAAGTLQGQSLDRLNFLVSSVDLGGAATQPDIIRAIGRELRSVVSARAQLKEQAKAFWDWASNWKILGVRYHKEEANFDPQDAADELINQVANLCG